MQKKYNPKILILSIFYFNPNVDPKYILTVQSVMLNLASFFNSNHKTKTFVTFIILLKAPLVGQGVRYLNTLSSIELSGGYCHGIVVF